ncbi:MAG: response regulator transcription factor [Ignavibacteria bacterium]|nr:response regulator transcription factor [Ignavibacteria bacterium]
MITVAIVEDDIVLAESYARELGSSNDISVVAVCTTAADARIALAERQPNVIVLDLVLPDTPGHTLIMEVRTLVPKADIMVLTAFDDYQRIYDSIAAGAMGYLTKILGYGELAGAVRQIHAGESPVSAGVARKILLAMRGSIRSSPELEKLSRRELEVLQFIASGYSYLEVATSLNISLETVRTHIRNAYKKLHINSRREAANLINGMVLQQK